MGLDSPACREGVYRRRGDGISVLFALRPAASEIFAKKIISFDFRAQMTFKNFFDDGIM